MEHKQQAGETSPTSGITTQEAAQALAQIAPAMQRAWEHCVGESTFWQLRVDGPAYRQTFLLGQFRRYRQFRTWLLRRQLSGKGR